MREYFDRLERVAAIFARAELAHLSLRERVALKFLGSAAPPVKEIEPPPYQRLPDGEKERPDREPVLATHAPIIPPK